MTGEWRELWEVQALTEPSDRHGLLSGGRSRPAPPALHSHALNQLLHVLDLAAQLLGLWEALLTFMKRAGILVLCKKPALQDTGLHSRCGDVTVSRPCCAYVP